MGDLRGNPVPDAVQKHLNDARGVARALRNHGPIGSLIADIGLCLVRAIDALAAEVRGRR